MGKLWRKVYFRLNRARMERELAEEMESHRAMMAQDRREFGNSTQLREQARDTWGWRGLDEFLQDLAFGARVLWRSPGFTLGAIVVLALGVGVNLAEFEIFDTMIFHRLSVRDAAQILQFARDSQEGSRLGFPGAAVEFYRAQSRGFAWLISEDTSYDMLLEGDAGQRSNFVSANYFTSLGVRPLWGRTLDAADARPGAPPVAVLAYEYWQQHWAGDSSVVGRQIHINGHPVEVVGVLPSNFEGLMARGTTVVLPLALRPVLVAGSGRAEQDYSRASQTLYGKLLPGISQSAGDAELTQLARQLAAGRPQSVQPGERIQSHLLQESIARSIQRSPAIAVFIVMVLLVLLSACANLANMLLARGLARQKEIDIRTSIGASRARMVRQLMTENLLLALLGAAAGVGVAAVSARLLLRALGAPPAMQVSTTGSVVVGAFILTCLSAAVFGLPSALQTVRRDRRKTRLRQGLVGVQVAVSCLLLIASGVLAHNGILSTAAPLAFDYPNLVTVRPQWFGKNLTPAVARTNLEALALRLAALPGVDGVTLAVAPPLTGHLPMDSLPALPHIYRNSVDPSYFAVMNVPVVVGRPFRKGEREVAAVSESAARAIWPNQDPVGKLLKLGGVNRTVTGVVKDSGANLLIETGSVEAYVPIDDGELDQTSLLLHARTDPAAVARLIPSAAASGGEGVSVALLRTARDRSLEGQRKLITLIGSIGALASVLASAGMFALVAFAVAQRRRELGIRMAIGAKRRHILGVLLRQHWRPSVVGAIAGVGLAAALSRVVRAMVMLPNRDTVDAVGFAAGLAGFVLMAVLAMVLPAVKALRIDPAATLREE